jgi:hypothetical protein
LASIVANVNFCSPKILEETIQKLVYIADLSHYEKFNVCREWILQQLPFFKPTVDELISGLILGNDYKGYSDTRRPINQKMVKEWGVLHDFPLPLEIIPKSVIVAKEDEIEKSNLNRGQFLDLKENGFYWMRYIVHGNFHAEFLPFYQSDVRESFAKIIRRDRLAYKIYSACIHDTSTIDFEIANINEIDFAEEIICPFLKP